MGEYFNKLRQFRDGVDFDTSATDGAYQLAKQKLSECREALESFRANPGLKGQTWNAASQWLSQYESDLTTLTESLDTAKTSYDTARAIMSSAKAEAGDVSSELISSAERSMFAGEDGIEVNGTVMTGAQYTSYIYQQRDAERERVSKDILDRMNAAVVELVPGWGPPPVPIEDDVDTSAQESAYSGGQASSRPTAASGGTATGGSQPAFTTGTSIYRQQVEAGGAGAWSYSAPAAASGAASVYGVSRGGHLGPLTGFTSAPTTNVGHTGGARTEASLTPYESSVGSNASAEASSGPGVGGGTLSSSKPSIRDGYFPPYDQVHYTQHVINPTWTSDGPVGGYTPPSVLDANDPRWSPTFGGREAGGSIMAGGVLGAGGAALGGRLEKREGLTALGGGAAVSGALGAAVLGGAGLAGLAGGTSAGSVVTGGAIGPMAAGGASARGIIGAAGFAGSTSTGGMLPGQASSGAGAANAARTPIAGMAPGMAGQNAGSAARSGAALRGSAAAGVRGGANVIGANGNTTMPAAKTSGVGSASAGNAGRGVVGGMAPGAASQTQSTTRTGAAGGQGAAARGAAGVAKGQSGSGQPAGARGAAGAASGNRVGMMPMGHAGRKEERKDDGATFVGYDVDRLEEQEEAIFDESRWAGGSIDQLAPIQDRDGGDDW